MAAKAKEQAAKPEFEEIEFTERQLRHVNRLRGQIDMAQQSLRDLVAYIGDEHGIELDGSWMLGDTGFRRPLRPAPPPAVDDPPAAT